VIVSPAVVFDGWTEKWRWSAAAGAIVKLAEVSPVRMPEPASSV